MFMCKNMSARFMFLTALLFLLTLPSLGWTNEQERVIEIAQAVEKLGTSQEFWPGYDPIEIPLAIFGGENTYLFRHPAPPNGFKLLEAASIETYIYPGRHPAVNANSSSDIAGSISATLLADNRSIGQSTRQLAAVALHEAFHVYQRIHHPKWAADEGALFLYPVVDPDLLAIRRLEMEGLRRALADKSLGSCWAKIALEYRQQRFSRMDLIFTSYERGTEMNEGLASYVQFKVNGQDVFRFPDIPFKATEIRQRAYITGPALALLLDQFSPGWSRVLEEYDEGTLDILLQTALEKKRESMIEHCRFSNSEIAEVKQTAKQDAEQIVLYKKKLRKELDQKKGWRIFIQASNDAPLWPQGFDPLNINSLEDGLLHTRWLRLGNDNGQLNAIDEVQSDISALTRGAGDHPLYNGIAWVMIAGLQAPDVDSDGGVVNISAPGFNARFSNATTHVGRQEITVMLH